MEWPEYQQNNPVYLHAVRPGRGRPRLNSDHPNRQAFYVQDHEGMLVPAAPAGGQPVYRSASTSHNRPASVVIHNSSYDTHSPVRGRRGSHGHEYEYDSDYSDHGHHHSHSPRRHRSHSHHHHYESRSPSPRYLDPKLEERMKRLEVLEKAEEEKAQRKAIEDAKKIEEMEKKEKEKKAREKYLEEQMIEAEKKRQKEADDKKRREEWIKDYKREQDEEKKKEEKKKKEEEEHWREKTIQTFKAAGYTEESIEKMLKKADKKKDKEKSGHGESGKQLMRPTYIKVHRKYMSTETLDEYELPWEWAEDMEYIVIKRWINEHDQEELFKHTAKLRDKHRRKKIEDTAIELRKENGKLQLVEKKGRSPGRSRSRSRTWLFT